MRDCPKCGGELDEDGICIECGYDVREGLTGEEWGANEEEEKSREEKGWVDD